MCSLECQSDSIKYASHTRGNFKLDNKIDVCRVNFINMRIVIKFLSHHRWFLPHLLSFPSPSHPHTSTSTIFIIFLTYQQYRTKVNIQSSPSSYRMDSPRWIFLSRRYETILRRLCGWKKARHDLAVSLWEDEWKSEQMRNDAKYQLSFSSAVMSDQMAWKNQKKILLQAKKSSLDFLEFPLRCHKY